jgi:outer membrane protein OmpA-like peptidoglycan-associated protein
LSRRNFLKLAAGACSLWITSVRAQSNPEGFNIFFDFGQSELTDSAKNLLDSLTGVILPTARVTISGNCDSAEAEPEKLGFARANAVLTHLLRHGSMAKVRFNVVNEGAAKPIVQTPLNTREPRNRRVEIVVTG